MNKLTGKGILIAIFFMSGLTLHAQEYYQDGWLRYERGFEFKKGIYTTFEEFRNNQPAISNTFEKRNGSLFVKNDSTGKWQQLRKEAWGYSNGVNIFVKAYYGYVRIGMIGELSYFAVTTGAAPGASIALSSAGGVGIGVRSGSTSAEEYLLDFQTGKFIPFTRKNFETILKQRDPLMFEQYKKRKGKKKEKMHLYLNAYNDAHPIYFPEK